MYIIHSIHLFFILLFPSPGVIDLLDEGVVLLPEGHAGAVLVGRQLAEL